MPHKTKIKTKATVRVPFFNSNFRKEPLASCLLRVFRKLQKISEQLPLKLQSRQEEFSLWAKLTTLILNWYFLTSFCRNLFPSRLQNIVSQQRVIIVYQLLALCKKCPNTEFYLVHIWRLFTQCW